MQPFLCPSSLVLPKCLKSSDQGCHVLMRLCPTMCKLLYMLHDAHKMNHGKSFISVLYHSSLNIILHSSKILHKIVEILFGVQNLNQTQPCHSLDPLKTGKDVIVYKKSLSRGFPNTAHKYCLKISVKYFVKTISPHLHAALLTSKCSATLENPWGLPDSHPAEETKLVTPTLEKCN